MKPAEWRAILSTYFGGKDAQKIAEPSEKTPKIDLQDRYPLSLRTLK
jgi:hypothetical protein